MAKLNDFCTNCGGRSTSNNQFYYPSIGKGDSVSVNLRGKIVEKNKEGGIIYYDGDENCKFYISFNNVEITGERGDFVSGSIGETSSKGSSVKFEIRTSKNGGAVNPEPYFDGTCGKSEEKNSKEKENQKEKKDGSPSSDTSKIGQVYKTAALPFYATQYGLKKGLAVAGVGGFLGEEIERIKKLMK